MSYTDKANDILKHLGLAVHMRTGSDDPLYCYTSHLYDNSLFNLYSPNRYRNDKKLIESDHVYGFGTSVFLHLMSGIRMEYDIHESWSGNDEYKLSKLFIITINNEALDVLDVDFEKKLVVTKKGNYTFNQLKRYTEKTD